jgi:hypothetical protein
MDTVHLLGSAAGLGLLAGIRLYFTVFALGLSIRLGWFQPREDMASLAILASTPILAASALLCLTEFFADKVPWFDTIWDSVHTFIRPIGAAILGITALGQFNPEANLLIGLLSGGVAFTSHASKAATRTAINTSPEPFSNWAASLAEDLMVPAGLWLVITHPLIAAVLVLLFLLVFVLVARWIWKLFRSSFDRIRGLARA